MSVALPSRERLVDAAVVGRAVVAVRVDEAAVEGREQPRALVVRDHHRPAYGGVRRLVAARIVGERGARVVEPGDVGDDARIVGLGAEGRHQHRWATLDRRAGRLPDPFAGQPVREDRLDPRRPRQPPSLGAFAATPVGGRLLQLRPALLRRVPGVVDVLDLVDQLVAEGHIGSHPLDAARDEGHARRPQHPVRVRVDRGEQQQQDDHDHDSAPPPPASGRTTVSRPPQTAHARHPRLARSGGTEDAG